MELYIKGLLLKRERADFDRYPFRLPIVQSLRELRFRHPVTFLVGENGTGKSTLLEALAVQYGFNAEGGSRNFQFSTAETHSDLWEAVTLVKGPYRPQDGYFLRAESYYNVASEVDRLYSGEERLRAQSYGAKSLHEQSHGESFLSLILHRFRGKGLYILDEPESALSPSRQLALLARLHDLTGQGSQFIISTHSPILMAYPGADIYVLGEEGLRLTPYERVEHVVVTKRFLSNPQAMLQQLWEET